MAVLLYSLIVSFGCALWSPAVKPPPSPLSGAAAENMTTTSEESVPEPSEATAPLTSEPETTPPVDETTAGPSSNELIIHFIDVQQGDATLSHFRTSRISLYI